ncbi:MAG: diguanylate cyclase [Desulfuromonadales bacterium]|nr:MAG: diguanylate cyclase [Desulfuromonadales bacterium]
MLSDDSFYKKVLDNLYDGIYFVNEDRRITYWNRGASLLTGYSETEAMKKACSDLFMHIDAAGKTLCSDTCPIEETMRDGRKREIESYFHHKDGHLVPVCLRIAPIKDSNGQMVVAVEVSGDHSPRFALRQQLEQLQRLALCDPLTTLANRRYIEMSLNSRLEEMRRYGWHFGFLFMDIDHFKVINDTHGHEAGDRALKMVANTLVNSARTFDVVGRWGGEEFVAILANITSDQLAPIADRFRHLVEQSSFSLGDTELRVTVSVGATMSQPDDTAESIVQRADRLMYESKNTGRNCVSVA